MGALCMSKLPPSPTESLALRLFHLLGLPLGGCLVTNCSVIVSLVQTSLVFTQCFLPFSILFVFFIHEPLLFLPLLSNSLISFSLFPFVRVQDMMDDICQEQFMEMSYLNGGQDHGGRVRGGMPVRGRGVPPAGAHRCGDTCTDTLLYNNRWVGECCAKTQRSTAAIYQCADRGLKQDNTEHFIF